MTQAEGMAGHRLRLRRRFLADPTALSDAELLELALTFAIPRQDTAPQARALLDRFGSPSGVLAASYSELLRVSGIGEQSALLLRAISRLADGGPDAPAGEPAQARVTAAQASLFATEEDLSPGPMKDSPPAPPQIRTFANDEAANALAFIPQATQFSGIEAFRAYLRERLPYNSATTRRRRANYIVERFFPEGRLDVPMSYYAARCGSPDDLKPALFYHLLRAEPLVAKVAEELIWPALPAGRVDREEMREFVLRYLPDSSPASQAKILQSLFNAYAVLGVATEAGVLLRFQAHPGTLEGFLYVLTAEFPIPGIYTFEALEGGPMRRWLLWDRDWLRRQLYNLQDLGVISKVSEIDAARQFTLHLDQMAALQGYFENPKRGSVALREDAET